MVLIQWLTDATARLPGLQSQLYHLGVIWPGASCMPSLSLSLLPCNTEMIVMAGRILRIK